MTDAVRLTVQDLPDPKVYDRFHPFLSGVFSQWHPAGFEIEGQAFGCGEQWMMVSKARLFGDEGRAAAIMATADPAEQKRHGQLVEGFESAVWDAWKVEIVHRGDLAKFTQNPGPRASFARRRARCWSRRTLATGSGAAAWRRTTRTSASPRPGGARTCWGVFSRGSARGFPR